MFARRHAIALNYREIKPNRIAHESKPPLIIARFRTLQNFLRSINLIIGVNASGVARTNQKLLFSNTLFSVWGF
jgi:hypothetical protein